MDLCLRGKISKGIGINHKMNFKIRLAVNKNGNHMNWLSQDEKTFLWSFTV